MSLKGKNLQYESKEPEFLRKLRGEIAQSHPEDPDRHANPVSRPTRGQNVQDEDDGPTYVLEESGDILSKDEYEGMLSRPEAEVHDNAGGAKEKGDGQNTSSLSKADDGADASDELSGQKELIPSTNPFKKRKLGRVIGRDVELAEETNPSPRGEDAEMGQKGKDATFKPPKKKKAKSALLSFDAD